MYKVQPREVIKLVLLVTFTGTLLSYSPPASSEAWVEVTISPGLPPSPSSVRLNFNRSEGEGRQLLITSLNLADSEIALGSREVSLEEMQPAMGHLMGQWFVSRDSGSELWIGLRLQNEVTSADITFRFLDLLKTDEVKYPPEFTLELWRSSQQLSEVVGQSGNLIAAPIRGYTVNFPDWASNQGQQTNWIREAPKRWGTDRSVTDNSMWSFVLMEKPNWLAEWMLKAMAVTGLTALCTGAIALVISSFLLNNSVPLIYIRLSLFAAAALFFGIPVVLFDNWPAVFFTGKLFVGISCGCLAITILPPKSYPAVLELLKSFGVIKG